MKEKEPYKAKIGGKFGFTSLPNHLQEDIKKRLAERDVVMNAGLKGILPGIKIDGKQVTRENIKDFEVGKTLKKEEVKKEEEKEPEEEEVRESVNPNAKHLEEVSIM